MNEIADHETTLVINRNFAAPVDQVFAAWTDPEIVKEWFAPGPLGVGAISLDARVGGRFRIEMRAPDGETHTTTGEYTEMVPNKRVSSTWQWEGSDDVTALTVEFRPNGAGGTEVTLTHARFPSTELRDQHGEGWEACLVKLEGIFG